MTAYSPLRLTVVLSLVISLVIYLGSSGPVAASEDHHGHDEHRDEPTHTRLSAEQLRLAGVVTERAGARTIAQRENLFGVIEIAQDQLYHLVAPYPSTVERVFVAIGDRVGKGQRLASLRSTETLQTYDLRSPGAGQVIARHANAGEAAAARVLLEIADLSTVWVDMAAFPHSIEQLALGQPVQVADLHHHATASGVITYISPVMTGGHIARARTLIANEHGDWRPGMHIKASIETDRRQVPLAVRSSALQNYHGQSVVFVRDGDEFSARALQLGASDGDYVEVLDGLSVDSEYVSHNSFLIKADLLKAGASHDH